MSQVRPRTPGEEVAYKALIPRLLSGESPMKIARETGFPVNTLRGWKLRAKRKAGNQAPAPTPELKLDGSQLLPSTASAETVREFLLAQGERALPLLASFNESLEKGLNLAHSGIMEALDRVVCELKEANKDVLMNAGDGEGQFLTQMRKAPADTAQSVKALAQLVELQAAFFCIPHGTLKTEALKFSTPAPANHLHLHSHGKRSEKSIQALPAPQMDVIDVTPVAADVMAPAQVSLLRALDE